MRVPRRIGMFMLGLSGLFGMRTPPEPEVIAQTAPRRGATGSDGRSHDTESAASELNRGPARAQEESGSRDGEGSAS